jgi:antitoxin VapB
VERKNVALNVKNERVSRKAHELAELTGVSITVAIEEAIDGRLAELRRRSGRHDLALRLQAIGRKCAAEAPAGWLTRDFDSELYDERGLPR